MSNYREDDKHVTFTAAGTLVAGALIEIAGAVGIVDAKPDGTSWAAGELASATIRGQVDVPNSGIIFAAGATVGYDESADEAVVAAGGDFDCGVAVIAAAAADPYVRVLLPH